MCISEQVLTQRKGKKILQGFLPGIHVCLVYTK